MDLQRVTDYDAVRRNFRWSVPDHFNFAVDVVDRWAEDPQRRALAYSEDSGALRWYTFAEISADSRRLAALLRSLGVVRGDRVVVMLPRIPEWQVAVTACVRIGAVAIPSITMLSAADVAYRVRHSGACAVITTAAQVAKFDGIAGLPVRISTGHAPMGWVPFLEEADQGVDDSVVVRSEDPAIMYYTSGSTGSPKGVVHAAAALWAWRLSAEYWLSLDPGDVIWCTADTGWSKAGTSILFGPWSRGAAAVFHNGPFDPAQRFDLLRKFGASVFCAAATELRRLVVEPNPAPLPDLRLTVSAGESVNPELVERWRALAGTELLDGYGQTETLMTVTNMPGMPVRSGSMGRPLPGTTVAVLTDNKRAAATGIGELLIAADTPQLMLRYHDEPERTDACYLESEGRRWFRTGDNVEIDDDGYVFYAGRADDVINSAGYRIGPQEVENALSSHHAVQECAVVGTPDPGRGEVVTAFVVTVPGVVPDAGLASQLQDHVKAVTAPYKYPRRIEFVGDLPKTVTGKLRRNVLRDEVATPNTARTTEGKIW